MEIWKPFGQFKVGVVDVEWLGSPDITVDNVDPTQHLIGRIFYPSTGNKSWFKLFRGISWSPGVQYSQGLSSFIFFRRPKGWAYWIAKQAVFLISWLFGRLQRLDLHPGAPLARIDVRFPVVVFSHGLGGNRAVYSITCSELASQGYLVLALEHSEGTASAAKLAGGKGWRFYKGLGGDEGQVEKTRARVQEMKTALRVLRAMQKGEPLPGLVLSHGLDVKAFLGGALDLRCLAAVGHSYGGATTAALCAEDPLFRCGVCLDPWWPALPSETAALQAWRTKAPLLVMGSHDWNTPNINGELICDGERQASVLNAAKIRRGPGERNGAGAMLLVISGSSHNTYADHLALFSEHVGWVLRALGLTARLDPVMGIHLVNTAVLNFLSTHLPLAAEQRQLQTWAPSSGHTALDRIAELDKADRGVAQGLLASVFPGKDLLNYVSDKILNSVIRGDVKKKAGKKEESGKSNGGVNGQQNGGGGDEQRVGLLASGSGNGSGSGNDDTNAPQDVVTGEEVLESALPSADPASGLHPHAPGVVSSGTNQVVDVREGDSKFDARQRQVLRARLGNTYSDAVRDEHTDEMIALLGEGHVWKCEVHV